MESFALEFKSHGIENRDKHYGFQPPSLAKSPGERGLTGQFNGQEFRHVSGTHSCGRLEELVQVQSTTSTRYNSCANSGAVADATTTTSHATATTTWSKPSDQVSVCIVSLRRTPQIFPCAPHITCEAMIGICMEFKSSVTGSHGTKANTGKNHGFQTVHFNGVRSSGMTWVHLCVRLALGDWQSWCTCPNPQPTPVPTTTSSQFTPSPLARFRCAAVEGCVPAKNDPDFPMCHTSHAKPSLDQCSRAGLHGKRLASKMGLEVYPGKAELLQAEV